MLLNKIKIGKKNFSGNVFDRFQGLEILFENCSKKSVLDLGSNDGLISYEFAKNGANVICGIEKDIIGVLFSRRLFRAVPVESKFSIGNVMDANLKQYDIVLFLGLYHHLRKKYSFEEVKNFVDNLISHTNDYIAVRTPMMNEIDKIIALDCIFSQDPPQKNIGKIKIFKK
jgi:2-polyprenyl-3-methyl-5-hydroxy-6-metoxy-1,4-benzoquinol methylase